MSTGVTAADVLEDTRVARTESGRTYTVHVDDDGLRLEEEHGDETVETTAATFLDLLKRGEWYPKKTGSAFFDALREVRDT